MAGQSLGAAGARGGLITFVFQFAAMGLRIIGLVILARLIAPEVFGVVAIVTSIALFASNLIVMGLTMASAQYPGLSHQAKSALFMINAALGLVIAVLLICVAPVTAELYNVPVLAPLMVWIAIVPLATGLQTQFRVQLMSDLRFFALSLGEILAQIAALVAAVSLAILGQTYAAIVAQSILQPVLLLIFLVIAARWLPGRPGKWFTEVREVMRVGLHIFGMNAAKNVGRTVLLPAMGLVVPAGALGSFDRAQQMSTVPVTMMVEQLQRVAIPVLARLRDSPTRLASYFSKAQMVVGYGTATLFAVLAGLSTPLVTLLMGEAWQLAGEILGILSIGAAFIALSQTVQWAFIATGSSGAGAVLSVIAQPAILAVSLAGLPWGVIGVAVANSVAWLAYWPIASAVVCRASGLRLRKLLIPPCRALALFAAPVGLATFLCVQVAEGPPVVEVLLGILGGGITATLALLVPITRHDLNSAARVLRLATRPHY